jgi:hypothetical protein
MEWGAYEVSMIPDVQVELLHNDRHVVLLQIREFAGKQLLQFELHTLDKAVQDFLKDYLSSEAYARCVCKTEEAPETTPE